MKGKKKRDATGLPELPEARPLPQEANPGGTEGVDAARAIFNDSLGDPSVAKGVAIMVVLSVIAVVIGARQFGRAVA